MKFAKGDCVRINAQGLDCIATWKDEQVETLKGRPLWTSGSLPPDHEFAPLGLVSCYLDEARTGAVYNLHEVWLEPWPADVPKPSPDDIYAKCGPVSSEEALQILSRFNASHFRNTGREVARYSIPANPRRDDDLRLGAFIRQSATKDRRIAALEAELAAVRGKAFDCPDCGAQMAGGGTIRGGCASCVQRANTAEQQRDDLAKLARALVDEVDSGSPLSWADATKTGEAHDYEFRVCAARDALTAKLAEIAGKKT